MPLSESRDHEATSPSISPRLDEETPLIRSSRRVALEANANDWQKPPYFLLIEIALLTNVFLSGFDGTVTAATYSVIASELQHSSLASWITTAYLLTSTAVKPLYGRFSDIFGRRTCLLYATAMFAMGCLGCAISQDIISLIAMRALTGLGGGGLMTMATIINTDLIPDRQRGMYQALQNILVGSGAICGATLGGIISDVVGWRMCFLVQMPLSLAGLSLAATVVKPDFELAGHAANVWAMAWQRLDILGSVLLFGGLVLQLAALSLGSENSWSYPPVVILLTTSSIILVLFIIQEYQCKTIPVLPLGMMAGLERVALLVVNISVGVTAYGILFLMPFLFHTVLLDTTSVAGLRLVPPSLATPLGGLITGIVMRQGDYLTFLTRAGSILMVISSILTLTVGMEAEWKYSVYLMLGNFGQGMTYPSILFGFIRTSAKNEHAVATSLVYLTRSMGTVWGVAAVSTLIQSHVSSELEKALHGIPGAQEALRKLAHSTSAIRNLDPELRDRARLVYYETCRKGLFFILAMTILSLTCSFLVSSKQDQKEEEDDTEGTVA